MPASRAWAHRISCLDPPQTRPHVVVQDLGRMPAAAAVDCLRDIQEALVRADPAAAAFMMALQEALVAGLVPYDRLAELYRAAADAALESVQRLLLAPRGRKKKPPMPKRATDGEDTLGMRTWKARTETGDRLERLLLDDDPRVAHNVLINPRLTERDVLRMVNRRPVSPGVLCEVARAPRWNRRIAVRRALVFNPYTPTEMVLRFLSFMSGPDLRALAQDGSVHSEVSRQAAIYAAWRSPKTGGVDANGGGPSASAAFPPAANDDLEH